MRYLFTLSLFTFLLVGCANQKPRTEFAYSNKELNEGWQLFKTDENDLKSLTSSNSELPNETVATDVPRTVLSALVEAGKYKDVYYSDNLSKIDKEQFNTSWTYFKEFDLSKLRESQKALLKFDGINYRANIYLNGTLVSDTSDAYGVYNRFSFNINKLLVEGKNRLAVEVYPPKAGDFTIGFVDWAPVPPDKNMGLWRGVKIEINDAVSIEDVFVQSKVNKETLDEAHVTVSASLINNISEPVEGTLVGKLSDSLQFSLAINLKANEERKIVLTSEELSELNLKDPALWWPNNMGKANLYDFSLEFITHDDVVTDKESFKVGIREVEDYMNENGYRGYKVNGKEVLIKGGGWVDDLLLKNDKSYNESQVLYAKHMNMNTIRFEGFWGMDDDIYSLCDKYGLLAMVGFSCQWEWHDYIGGREFEEDTGFGAAVYPEAIDLLAGYWEDQMMWLRNHPSVFVWVAGSDNLPHPELEKKYLEIFERVNPSGLYLASAKDWKSDVSGPTGVKMAGPYDYVTPSYWYNDTQRGGAFGFNTETGPGPQPLRYSSLKKMMPEKDHWPIDNKQWQYHNGRHKFGTLEFYMKGFDNRYGKSDDIQDFSQYAQVVNYEAMRPMFEAFAINQPNATGIIQWMQNSAWPETYWQFYDYYLNTTGAFYGAKKAAEPLHLAYNYGDQKVYLVNDNYEDIQNSIAEIKVYSSSSELILEKSITLNNVNGKVQEVIELTGISDENNLYFVDLRLRNDDGASLTTPNFYWLSTKKDVSDFSEEEGHASWWGTYTLEYADLTYLRELPKAEVEISSEFNSYGEVAEVITTIVNKSDKVAFFLEVDVMGKSSKEPVLPVFWSDNNISLLPGETRKLKAVIFEKDLEGDEPVVSYVGINLE